MSDTNPLLRLPMEVQEKVEELRLQKQNALMIQKVIESTFGKQMMDQGIRPPTFTDINKYVKWAKKNRGDVVKSDTPMSASDRLFAEMDEEAVDNELELERVAVPESLEDKALAELIDLSTPKNTLEDVKKRLQLSINRLEKKRISLGNEYNDKLESTLKDYYKELAKHTQTEVKMAEELRDSDKVDVGTVNYIMNKLFQCVSQTVTEVNPSQREMFFKVLTENINRTKIDTLTDLLKEI